MAIDRRELRDENARAVLAQMQIAMLPEDWSPMRGRWTDLFRLVGAPVAA